MSGTRDTASARADDQRASLHQADDTGLIQHRNRCRVTVAAATWRETGIQVWRKASISTNSSDRQTSPCRYTRWVPGPNAAINA